MSFAIPGYTKLLRWYQDIIYDFSQALVALIIANSSNFTFFPKW